MIAARAEEVGRECASEVGGPKDEGQIRAQAQQFVGLLPASVEVSVSETQGACGAVEVVVDNALSRILRALTREKVRSLRTSPQTGGALSATDLWLLGYLGEHGGVRLGDLALWQDVDKSTISMQVKRLVAAGLASAHRMSATAAPLASRSRRSGSRCSTSTVSGPMCSSPLSLEGGRLTNVTNSPAVWPDWPGPSKAPWVNPRSSRLRSARQLRVQDRPRATYVCAATPAVKSAPNSRW